MSALIPEPRRRYACADPAHREHWVVIQRRCNHSAFNGYHYTPSDYSTVLCLAEGCGAVWRTKAGYVASLPDRRDLRQPHYG